MNTTKFNSPGEMATALINGSFSTQAADSSTTLSMLCLETYDDFGRVKISWVSANPDSSDWVGLYTGKAAGEDEYVTWARVKDRGGNYETGKRLHSGYQARYYTWDSTNKVYKMLGDTDVYPSQVCWNKD